MTENVHEDTNEQHEAEEFYDELDPRVQTELEKLNKCTDEINRWEKELEEANCAFRTFLSDSTTQLKTVARKIGPNSIERARPFFEAQEVSQRAKEECQAAASQYQRACSIHEAAKETITLAEMRFLSNSGQWNFDNAWQEMLNHATIKVMEAEMLKTESEAEHFRRAAHFESSERLTNSLQRSLKSDVAKTRTYFEQKDVLQKSLEAKKLAIETFQSNVTLAKSAYAESLHNLEQISDSIHTKRNTSSLINVHREPGVGAEQLECSLSLPSLPTSEVVTPSTATRSLEMVLDFSGFTIHDSGNPDSHLHI